jgi:hypothetical protein
VKNRKDCRFVRVEITLLAVSFIEVAGIGKDLPPVDRPGLAAAVAGYKLKKPEKDVEVKTINALIIAVVALLSFAAGLAKVLQTPQEMEFLQSFGLTSVMIVAFGLVQILGGVLLLAPKTRLPGAVFAASAFAVSAVLVFVAGNPVFGLVSILPLALAGVVIYQSARTTDEKSP